MKRTPWPPRNWIAPVSIMGLLAGAARVKLDPPPKIAMAGYGARGAPRYSPRSESLEPREFLGSGRSTGIHDDLAAQALVLGDGRRKFAIASVDVLALGPRIAQQVCDRIAKRTGIARDAAMICATHTHSGPAFNIWATPKPEARGAGPDRDLDWERALPGRIADAIVLADARLREATLKAASARFTLGTNRRLRMPDGSTMLAANYAGVADSEAKALGFYGADGGAIAFILNYPCHGVVLCEDNLLYSRDYMGFALDEIEALGGAVAASPPIALFLNGATGNIDPRSRGSFAIAEEHGRALGRDLFDGLAHAPETRCSQVLSREIALTLRLKDLASAMQIARGAVAQTELSLARHRAGSGYHLGKLESQRDRAIAMLRALEAMEQANRRDRRADVERGELTTRAVIAALGEVAMVGLPGEAFVEFGLALKANPWFRHTLVAGYCNDLIGYIPTREAWAEGGYEVDSARVAAGSGEAIVTAVLAELSSIAGAVS